MQGQVFTFAGTTFAGTAFAGTRAQASGSAPFENERRLPWRAPRGLPAVVDGWTANPSVRRCFALTETVPPRAAETVPLPADIAPGVRDALTARGIEQLYSHQAQALALARDGTDLVIATPTASGKSLCYNLPVLDRLARDPHARALYLFPTKALSRDQEEALRGLLGDAGLSHGAITFDGDTPGDARRAARERAGVLLTNPDMLHAGILPHHASWARLFADLRFVVVDEVHSYRGVFGAHLANVMRRLARIARFHGSDPTFVFASATIGNPAEHAGRIAGRPVVAIRESGAPAGERRVLVYNPPVVNPDLGLRASYLKSAVRLAGDLVEAGVSTLVFGQSRNSVEVMLKYLRDRLCRPGTGLGPDAIHAYRGGYLAHTRRRIERALRSGDIRCVVATSALELGIDIGSLEAVVCAGYPGSVAGLWQRFGRAGRRQAPSLSLLVPSSAPLDQFFAKHPRRLVDDPVEHARIDPDNVEILVQHLKCAAFELPFEGGEGFGDVPAEAVADALGFLTEHGVLHQGTGPAGTPTWHWATDAYPATHVGLRNVGWDNFVIVDCTDSPGRTAGEPVSGGASRGSEGKGGKTLAEMDWRSTHTMLHVQAIYQHGGHQYQVEHLDFENHKAYVRRVDSDYYTDAMTYTRVTVLEEEDAAPLAIGDAGGGPGVAPRHRLATGVGEVSVIAKVIGYKKIKFHTHETVGYGDVHLPEMQMHTTAFWTTFPEPLVGEVCRGPVAIRSSGDGRDGGAPPVTRPPSRPEVVDAIRGIGNAVQVVAAAGLMTDPRDLGLAVGDRRDPDGAPGTGQGGGAGFDPTVFLYDRVAGGIGLAGRLFEERDALLRRARELVVGCDCDDGCPACIGPEAGVSAGSPIGTQAPRPPAAPVRRRALALALLDAAAIPTLQ